MTIKEALAKAKQVLERSKITSANLDAEVLLMHAMNITKEVIHTYPEKKLTFWQLRKYRKLLNKRTKAVPIAYLTGTKEFYGLEFKVNKDVLVPRPETEILVETALNLIKQNKLKSIADIGTGSGAIPIAIWTNKPKVKMIATDISKKALKTAKQNAELNKARITFLRGDLLKPIKNEKVDLITANLPYLDETYADNLNTSNLKAIEHEPQSALYSGQDGLDDYRRFFQEIKELSTQPKFVLIEHDPRQTNELHKIIKKNLPKSRFKTIKDLCGLDRITQIDLKQ